MEAFQAAHGIEELVIVAGAGMLSATNLTALDEARLRFIVGACTTRTPGDLKTHFHWAGGTFTDGRLINTTIPRKTQGASGTCASVMSRGRETNACCTPLHGRCSTANARSAGLR